MRVLFWAVVVFFLFGCVMEEPAGAHRPDWGLYQIYWGFDKHRLGWEEALAEIGATPDYAMFFRDLVRPFPTEAVQYHHDRGTRVIISLELEVWGHGELAETALADIAAGRYDPYFERFAKGAAAAGQPVILRFGFEMNGDWFPWGAQPKAFLRAWRHAHETMSVHDAGMIAWMFSPNVLWADRSFASDYAPYYPGDASVDWVGLDGYNFGDDHSPHHQWQSFEEIFGRSVEAMRRFDKPLMLAEVGCADDPRKAKWIRGMLATLSEMPEVEAFIYFNYDKRREGEPNWQLSSQPKALDAFRKWVQAGNEPSARAP